MGNFRYLTLALLRLLGATDSEAEGLLERIANQAVPADTGLVIETLTTYLKNYRGEV